MVLTPLLSLLLATPPAGGTPPISFAPHAGFVAPGIPGQQEEEEGRLDRPDFVSEVPS